jgi:ATP-dependent DNA helicase RecG
MTILLLLRQLDTTLSYPVFHPRSRRPSPLTVSASEFRSYFPTEGFHVEFKAGVGTRPIQETAVAFSNADGGIILIGMSDAGEILGRTLDPGTEDALHDALVSASDLGRYELHALDVNGVGVSVLAVARREEGFAQTSNGRVLVRRGSRDDPLFGADLQRFINQRAHVRFEAAVLAQTATMPDAALVTRVAAAHAWGEVDLERRLEEAGLVRDQKLTVAGALFLTPQPHRILGKTYIEVLRYPDDDGLDYDRRDEYTGPLDEQMRATVERLVDDLGTELVVLGTRRYELPRVPEVVVREAIANAVAHRSYEISGVAVRVERRPGSIRVISPGGLPEPVTVRNIREASAARNLDVIRVLRRMGLAEDAGRGVDVMQDTMRSEMLEPPEFIDHGHAVEVVLPIRSPVAASERAWVRELETRGDLGGDDRLILVHAARGDVLTNARARQILQADAHAARAVLQRLRDQGLLLQRGDRGGATYSLAGSLHPPAGLRLSPEEIDDLIVALATARPISNADVREATGLDRVAALTHLERLTTSGRLVRSGARRGTRYARR